MTPFEQAFAPFDTAPRPQNNVLSNILGGGFNPSFSDPGPLQVPQVQMSQVQTPKVRMPRERASALDIIGGIADAVAEVGGSTPMYQPTLDARENRRLGMEMQELERRRAEQQIQAGEAELGGLGREQLGQALAGLAQSEDPATDWPALAELAGIPPDKAAAIGREIQRGVSPQQLAVAFGYSPPAQGSRSAMESEYALRLATLGPEAANEWLRTEGQSTAAPKRRTYSINAGDRIIEYDIESGAPVRSIPVGARPAAPKAGSPTGQDALSGLQSAFRSNRRVITDMRKAIDDMAAAGSINAPGQSAIDRAAASAYRNLPFVEQVFNQDGFDARQRLESSAIAAITALEPLIQQAQGAGMPMTSKMMDTPKELEVRLQAIVNAKSKEAAIEAWQRFKDRYDEAEREISRLPVAGARAGSRPAASRGTPNPALEAELRRRGILR